MEVRDAFREMPVPRSSASFCGTHTDLYDDDSQQLIQGVVSFFGGQGRSQAVAGSFRKQFPARPAFFRLSHLRGISPGNHSHRSNIGRILCFIDLAPGISLSPPPQSTAQFPAEFAAASHCTPAPFRVDNKSKGDG